MSYSNIPEKFNIASYLIDDCNLNKDHTDLVALYCENEKYTYGEVAENVNRFSNYLTKQGLNMGDKIGILLSDSAEYVFLFLAAIKVGVVPVLINLKVSNAVKNEIISETQISFLFTSKKDRNTEDKFIEPLTEIIFMDDILKEITEESIVYTAANTTKDDIAFIIFTSGSNGQPKGVVHLQHDMLICAETYGKHVLKSNEKDIFCTHSKLSFAFGLGNKIFLPFYAGASSIITDDDSIYGVLDIMQKYEPTIFMAVPSVYQSINKMVKVKSILSSLRICVSAGELMPRSIAEDWKEKFGINIIQGIGSTETLFIAISNTIEENRIGSVGKCVPGYTAKILDENGREILDYNTIGELYISGESIMQGYWNNKKATINTMVGEGVKTGDRVYKDADGYYWYVGRNSDTFKINGTWVSSAEIENAILKYGNVEQALVIGDISNKETTTITAFIVPTDNTKEWNKLDMRRFISKIVGRELCPKKFIIVEEIPKGPTGKMLRGKIENLKKVKEIC